MRDSWRDQDAEAALAERFGANVARLRRARGLSQTDLGERAAIHRNDLSLIELGKRPTPDRCAARDRRRARGRARSAARRDRLGRGPERRGRLDVEEATY